MMPSPRMNRYGICLFCVFTISSSVSSSTSMVVTVSSTSPKIMLRCWSYACNLPRRSLFFLQAHGNC